MLNPRNTNPKYTKQQTPLKKKKKKTQPNLPIPKESDMLNPRNTNPKYTKQQTPLKKKKNSTKPSYSP